jgi:hypothetical protein
MKPPYPWESEPDSLEREYRGFPIKLRRNTELGTWCGYVVVPEGHPWHGCAIDDPKLDDVRVHGGITYAGDSDGALTAQWMVGFDCGHAFDMVPMFVSEDMPGPTFDVETGTYRDMGYVLDECMQLADQAARARHPGDPAPSPDDPLDRTDEELTAALRALRGEPAPKPPTEPGATYTPVRDPGETDGEFKRRIIEDHARMAAGMAPRRRRSHVVDDPERKDPW